MILDVQNSGQDSSELRRAVYAGDVWGRFWVRIWVRTQREPLVGNVRGVITSVSN